MILSRPSFRLRFIFVAFSFCITACSTGSLTTQPGLLAGSSNAAATHNSLDTAAAKVAASTIYLDAHVEKTRLSIPRGAPLTSGHSRKALAVTDSWEKPSYYQPPPSSVCLVYGNHDASPVTGGAGYSGDGPPVLYDCWVAAFDSVAVPTFTSQPCNYNPNCPMAAAPPIDNCKATSWAAGYDYGSLPDGYLSASVKPSTTSAGAPNCLRYDKGVTLTIKRSSSAPDTNAEAIGAHGSFTYCFYTDCLFDENAESNVVAFIADYPSMPPPPCVMYSAAADSAATAHNIDPALLAAVAATESGNPRIDDGADIYQQGGPVPASGPCQNLCGVGPWQVDTAAHPGYTGGLDVTANANYAATVLAEAIHAAQNYLPASATLDQIYMAAGNYYNGGPNAMRGVYPTSAQTWNDGSQPYGVGLVRHYHRILDYKAVCENGTRG